MQDLTLRRGARLVHIGPHKTGTTSLQGAFHHARERLAEHDVLYARGGRQPIRAALAVTGRKEPLGTRQPRMAHWERLVGEVANTGDQERFVVSSEFFADGDDESAHRVVNELGGSLVHVVVTLRPLTRIVASQWQQYVQSGLRTGYEDWLRMMFDKPPYDRPTPSFWRRHSHDALVQRWAEAAGPENLTVVVADDADPMFLIRAFESLLELPSGILVPERERSNRSLTAAEVELVRLLNEEFRDKGLPDDLYARFLRYGAVMEMKTEHEPAPDEAKVVTPPWAVERAAAVGSAAADAIRRSGVRVVGDLDLLGECPTGVDPAETDRRFLATESAAHAVLGAIRASNAFDEDAAMASLQEQPVWERPVREADARSLMRVLAGRAKRRVGRELRRRR